MRYAYHFEFCERPEMPEWFRGDLFLSLGFVQNSFGLGRVLAGEVPELINLSGARRVIELGCGSGEGLERVARARPQLPVLATDKYPHPQLWAERLAGLKHVRWCSRSVGFDDFDRVLGSAELKDSVLLLNATFHHANPNEARAFLERAARVGVSLVIVEPLARSLLGAVQGLAVALPALLFPLYNAFSGGLLRGPAAWLRQAVLHWVLPLIPLTLAHDGVVSAFRQRTQLDWGELVEKLPFHVVSRQGLGPFKNFSAVLLKHTLPKV